MMSIIPFQKYMPMHMLFAEKKSIALILSRYHLMHVFALKVSRAQKYNRAGIRRELC